MKQNLSSQFEYNFWANLQIASALKGIIYPPKCLSLLSHIISAQDIWFERIKKTNSYQIEVWDEYTLPECEILIEQSNNKWKNYLTRISEEKLNSTILYRNKNGIEFTNSLKDIITHVLNHSNYHRGQINLLLSNAELKPATTDYIYYLRR